MLGSVGRGYSVALLLRGRETEAPRLVPQVSPRGCTSHSCYETQVLAPPGDLRELSPPNPSWTRCPSLGTSGRTRDLLAPGTENLSVLDVAPLGLVVENASEVEVSDSKAASELYLQAAGGEGSACSLLTVTMSCPQPDPPEGPGTQGMWRGALRILQLPGALGSSNPSELRESLSLWEGHDSERSQNCQAPTVWKVQRKEGFTLCLPLLGSSLSLLQAALLGAARRRMKVRQVRHTLWDAVEEARARRAGLKSLRSGLLGDALTDSGLSQLGRALRELQVSKVRPGGAWASNGQMAGRTASIGPDLHQMHPLREPEEQAQQAPDVALQFFLAQAQRQRLREQHQIWIQEELKHLEQEEEVVAGDQVKGLVAEEVALNKGYVLSLKVSEERQRWHREWTGLRLQLEALQVEWDTAEQDLTALYDLHVQAARAWTCHTLQVFRAWRGLWEEQATAAEHRYRSLLAGILQDTINLATQNQELQAQSQ
ncbi:LOW QUALITY PROTEIN: uncharacterized protein AAG666_009524 [Megaptera novaeangliae]